MTRKLLPYEHDLIATLGISKEEYLDFLAVQEQYKDSKEGTILDIRNDPVSIVLAVVGILFQVASILLMPRPKMPDMKGLGETQTREQRFSPRFGFNSIQELAKYGDPVNLVYTNTAINASGGVRVSSALLWSAVRSYGSNQFLQMLMLLGGGSLTTIDSSKSAFGQTAISDLISQNKWIYFRPNGTGILRFADEVNDNSGTDPLRYGIASDNPYRLQPGVSVSRVDGFSQAYSPSSSNAFGGYAPVPFAVYYYLRKKNGSKFGDPLEVYLQSSFAYALNGWNRPFSASAILGEIPVGGTLKVWIKASTVAPPEAAPAPTPPPSPSSSPFTPLAPAVPAPVTDEDREFIAELYSAKSDARRALASVFDDAGIFKLGSALFRVQSTVGTSPDEGDFYVNLVCIAPGIAPSIPYNAEERPATGTGAFVPATNFPAGTGAIFCSNAETSKLTKGQILYSPNGWYKLWMQQDGNLVIYNKAEQPVWDTGTAGTAAAYAFFQADGNLVLYDNATGVTDPAPNLPTGTGQILPTNTNASKLFKGQSLYTTNGWFRLTMQTDGNLVIYDKTGAALWSTNTQGSAAHYAYFQEDGNLVLYDNATGVTVPASNFPTGTGQILCSNTNASKLFKGQSLYSKNGWYRLWMQTDGNLVIYNKANRVIWNTNTAGTSAHYAYFQADGNLVLYDNSSANGGVGNPIWKSNNGQYPLWAGYDWELANDGELILRRFNDTVLYRTYAKETTEPTIPAPGNPIWFSNTPPTEYEPYQGTRWQLETNGELRLYSAVGSILWRSFAFLNQEPGAALPGNPIWFSNEPPTTYTAFQGQRWQLENTGELILYTAGNSILWRNNIASDEEPGSRIVVSSLGNYQLKVLARVETARYSSVSKCHILDIALRAQIFRRISGRQRQYGSDNVPGYPTSDNGMHQRTSIFLVHYRLDGGAWALLPGLFVCRRAAEQDNYIYLKLTGDKAYNWEIALEPVIDPLSEIVKHPQLKTNQAARYFYLENNGSAVELDLYNGIKINFTGYIGLSDTSNLLPPVNKTPGSTNEWDWFSLDADTQYTTSFDRGPEFVITAVTEQQRETFNTTRLYKNLSLIGFNVFSGKALQDLRSFTAFVTQGRKVRQLNTSTLTYPQTPDGASCYAPDIFLDTVIDKQDGIGNYADLNGVDTRQLAITKRFCQRNNLFMDGIIADRGNWREFWVNTAPFSLLEFARIGGRETLIPAVPYDATTGAMDRTVNIMALFNQGNILADSYKEEFMDYDANAQDTVATVMYRALDNKGVFAVTKSVTIQRADAIDANAVQQNFDLSAFVTTEAQAILFGKLICNIRRYVRSSIEFKTFPTNSPIVPGAFIYVDIGNNTWNGIYTGVVKAGGELNVPIQGVVPDGTYNILLYRSGNDVVSTITSVANNTAAELANREGWLFVLGTSVKSKRVYRVGEVSMDEEGEMTVRATIYPCDVNDQSLIADFSDSLFTINR